MTIDWHKPLLAGNELWQLAALFGVILICLIVVRIIRSSLRRVSVVFEKRSRHLSSEAVLAISRSSGLIGVAIALPASAMFLTMGEVARGIVDAAGGILLSLAIGFTLYQLVDALASWLRKRAEDTPSSMDDMLVPIVQTSLRVTIVALTLLQIIQSLTDRPLTSIIAGLGVGGLAVALAAQDTIKHFFGSVVLFTDRPFQVGERVAVDDVDGNIEQVGFRSTRIRTLEGHLVTMPNGDLANKTIVNIGRRPHIRHRMVLGITYDTPVERTHRALAIVRELLDGHEGMSPDFPPRVAFHDFGASSLNILVMFWYHPADYWAYLAYLEKLNLELLEAFNREGIEFAFPTQTLYLAGDTKRPLSTPRQT